MNSPLIVDPTDTKWLLLDQTLAVTTSRRAKQEMAKCGLTPIQNTGSVLRVLLIALFFSLEITYVVDELQNARIFGDLRISIRFLQLTRCIDFSAVAPKNSLLR